MENVKKFNQFINEEIDFSSKFDEIDAPPPSLMKYFVGYIDKKSHKPPFAWTIDGQFQGFSDSQKAMDYIKDLKERGIPEKNICVISKSEYADMYRCSRYEGEYYEPVDYHSDNHRW